MSLFAAKVSRGIRDVDETPDTTVERRTICTSAEVPLVNTLWIFMNKRLEAWLIEGIYRGFDLRTSPVARSSVERSFTILAGTSREW
jgi:hypothetical protein